MCRGSAPQRRSMALLLHGMFDEFDSSDIEAFCSFLLPDDAPRSQGARHPAPGRSCAHLPTRSGASSVAISLPPAGAACMVGYPALLFALQASPSAIPSAQAAPRAWRPPA